MNWIYELFKAHGADAWWFCKVFSGIMGAGFIAWAAGWIILYVFFDYGH